MKPLLEIRDLGKSFGTHTVIDDVNFEVYPEETVAILGQSGVGKSTLFQIVAGLSKPDTGDVLLEGESIVDKPGSLAYMLQKDLLLNHKTVMENAALPLTIQGMDKTARHEKVMPYLDTFGLAQTENKYPRQLSGGMRQRVAFLRTYMMNKPIMLLDEPFSALDPMTKYQIHEWYQDLSDKFKITTLFITHDVEEAIKLSDRILILNGAPGRIQETLEIASLKKKHSDFLQTAAFLELKASIQENFMMKP